MRAAVERQAEREQLRELARRVDRLVPSHRDPHAFFEEKSEISAALRQLARLAGGRRDE